MTDPNRPFHNPDLRTAVGAPVHGGDTATSPTPNSAEVAAHAAAQAEVAASQIDAEDDVVTSPARRRGGKVVATVLAGTTAIGGGAALEATNVIDVIPNWPAAHAPANPDTNPDNGEGGIDSGKIVIELSPESIANQTPEQLTEEFSISAVDANGNPITPEAYVDELTENYEGALNAGITTEEISAYTNQVGYEDAKVEQYDTSTGPALFANQGDIDVLSHNHWQNLLVAKTAAVVSPEQVAEFGNYAQNVELTDFTVVPGATPESGFDVTFTWDITTNAVELDLVEFYEAAGKDILADERTVTYTAHIENVDGYLKPTSGLKIIT